MKRSVVLLMALAMLLVFCFGALAEEAAPAAPMFSVNVTQLLIAVLGIIFNALLAWICKAVIPPLKAWLKSNVTTETQNRTWTMIKWLVEAAEQTITGYAMGGERLTWVIGELQTRGITVDTALIEAAVKEMKDNAYKEIKQVVEDEEDCEACKISADDGK